MKIKMNKNCFIFSAVLAPLVLLSTAAVVQYYAKKVHNIKFQFPRIEAMYPGIQIV